MCNTIQSGKTENKWQQQQQSASMHSSTATQLCSIRTRHITLHTTSCWAISCSATTAVRTRSVQQAVVGRAGEYIDWCNSQQLKKSRWYSSSIISYLIYTYVLACMNMIPYLVWKKYASKYHVTPDREISAGTPIAGQCINTAVFPSQMDIVFQVWSAMTRRVGFGGITTPSRGSN